MQIVTPKMLGFCSGVERAIALAHRAREEAGAPIYTLGDIIHNDSVIAELNQEGIYEKSSVEEIPKGSICVVRTHGVGRKTYVSMQEKGIIVVDATCPSVRKIQMLAAQKESEGYRVLVFGNPEHPEVKGICGWGENICAREDFPNGLSTEAGVKWFLLAQTTASPERFRETLEKIANFSKNYEQTLEFFNSICYTTTVRLEECRRIAAECDTVFVIGDPKSNNTRGLYETAARTCNNVHFISNVTDIDSETIKHSKRPGILAGASTPKGLIMEVINRMDQENKLDGVEDVVAPVETTEEVAAKITAPEKTTEDEPITMEDAMKRYGVRSYREGMKLKARIISIDANGVSVAVEGLGKNDSGYIAADQMEYDGTFNPENYHVDDLLDVMVIAKTDPKSKSLNLSKRAYDKIKIEDEAVQRILAGEEFRLECTQVVKGGLLGHLGSYSIFVPASQIRMGYVKQLEDYVGKGKVLRLRKLPDLEEPVAAEAPTDAASTEGGEGAQPVVVAPAPKRKHSAKRIVASQRVILEEEKKEREDTFWDAMQENNIIKGKVKRFTKFGAFVSVMGFDCLAHISDLSWTRIKEPSEVLELNKTYEFVVLKADRPTEKVSLGYKQLQPTPYEVVSAKYHVGDVVKGKVERIKEFGAFVSIEPGVDGLVHISEISLERVENINDALHVGDEIEAKVKKVEEDPKDKYKFRISLSIRDLLKEREAQSNYDDLDSIDDEDRGKRNLERFAKRAEAATESGEHKERKPRTGKDRAEGDADSREYVASATGGATMAALFKGVDMSQFDAKSGSEEGSAE